MKTIHPVDILRGKPRVHSAGLHAKGSLAHSSPKQPGSLASEMLGGVRDTCSKTPEIRVTVHPETGSRATNCADPPCSAGLRSCQCHGSDRAREEISQGY